MQIPELEFCVNRGTSYSKVLRWGSGRLGYADITGATQAAPCLVTAVGHGIPDGWPIKISDVVGMLELNELGYVEATYVDDDTIELNAVNAKAFSPYKSGGTITFNVPTDMTGYAGRAVFREDRYSAVELLTWDTASGNVLIDASEHTITLQASPTETAAIQFDRAWVDVEMIAPSGRVSALARGPVTVEV